jgi:hypothetical protein
VYAITGTEMTSQLVNSNSASISTANWQSGVYFVQIIFPEGISSKKIIVQ